MGNKQEQLDELEVLRSIYGEDILIVNKNQGGGQFLVHPVVPQPFSIISHPEGGVKQEVQVNFLPPIVLHFWLPKDYPSARSPRFVLSCGWLTRKQLATLCQQLDTLWHECQPEVVLFRWTQFLQEDSLAHLGLHSQLDVSTLVPATGCANFGHLKLAMNKESSLAEDAVEEKAEENQHGKTKRPSPPKTSRIRPVTEIVNSHLTSSEKNRDRGGPSHEHSKRKGRGRGRRTETKATQENVLEANGDVQVSDTLLESRVLTDQEVLKTLKITPVPHHREPEIVFQEDHRAVVDLKPGTQPLPVIVEFNEGKQREMFNREWFKCKVCMNENPGYQCLQFIGCRHVFCKNCMQVYFEIQIKEGNVKRLTCPEEKCSSQATPAQVYELVGAELYERYDLMLLESLLASMGDLTYCPRQSCQFIAIKDYSENLATCERCLFAFCHFCRRTYHGLAPCRLKNDEKLKIMNDYQKGSSSEKLEMEKRYGKKQLTSMIEETMSEQWVRDCTKKCPHCSASIQKIDGCNKMPCWRCNTFFCWLCRTKLDPNTPYTHFNNAESKCFNLLFENVDVEDEDWEFGEFV